MCAPMTWDLPHVTSPVLHAKSFFLFLFPLQEQVTLSITGETGCSYSKHLPVPAFTVEFVSIQHILWLCHHSAHLLPPHPQPPPTTTTTTTKMPSNPLKLSTHLVHMPWRAEPGHPVFALPGSDSVFIPVFPLLPPLEAAEVAASRQQHRSSAVVGEGQRGHVQHVGGEAGDEALCQVAGPVPGCYSEQHHFPCNKEGTGEGGKLFLFFNLPFCSLLGASTCVLFWTASYFDMLAIVIESKQLMQTTSHTIKKNTKSYL